MECEILIEVCCFNRRSNTNDCQSIHGYHFMGSEIFGAASANSDSLTEVTENLYIFIYFEVIIIHEILVP